MQRRRTGLILVGCLLIAPAATSADVPAFSGAEGWGAITPGGRGGDVVHVTNLNDSGPGSFREALTASGPRTVVFDVAGQINLLSEVSVTNPYLTIAGQTAPDGGITIAGETTSIDTHDAIVRHIRFRRGSIDGGDRDDALGSDRTNSNNLNNPKTGNIIVDHVSASWGLDENLSLYRSKLDAPIMPGGSTIVPSRNITIQWSISSEALNPFHHAFGSTVGGAGVNQHHNLWASNTGRNPSISFSHFMDFRNNVLFNWMHRSVDGAGPEAHVNMINNFYKPGPATGFSNTLNPQPTPEIRFRIVEPEIRGGSFGSGMVGWWYVDGNYVEGYPTITADNWDGVVMVDGIPYHGVQVEYFGFDNDWARVLAPHTQVEFPDDPDDPFDDDGAFGLGQGNPLPIPNLPVIATQSAQDAYDSVLAGAGASLVRDAVDLRVVDSVATGNATAGPRGDGIINHPDDVGGYPVIPFVERGPDWDTDQDGMPNHWEAKHGLNSANAADRNNDFDTDGYTNLEEYLNELGAFQAVQDVVWDGQVNNRYARIENWDIAFQPSRFDTAVINDGTVVVDAIGQDAGTLKLGTNSGNNVALNITAGWLKVADELAIGIHAAATAAVNLSGGTLSVGELSLGSGGSFAFTGGTLSADQVNFDLANDGGTIAPGQEIASFHPNGPTPASSVGQMHVVGDLTISDGTLQVELASDALFDSVLVDDAATLAGDLEVALLGGFIPDSTDQFEILTADSRTGDFAGATWADAYLGFFDVTYTATSVLLSNFQLVGDYNGNGQIDPADYTVWRDSLGNEVEEGTGADGNRNGEIDADDFLRWRINFGLSVDGGGGSGQGQSNVPEPASLSLAMLGFLVFLVLGGRVGFTDRVGAR